MHKSDYSEEQKNNIITMKTHLKSLRLIAGWTPKELAAILGLSQQTILGFEDQSKNEKDEYNYKMSYVQYIALLSVFEQKAEEDKNESLEALLNLLFYKTDEYKKNKEKIDKEIPILAGAAGAALTGTAVGTSIASTILPFATTMLAPIGGGIAALTGLGVSLIAKTVLKNKNDTIVEKKSKK